MPSYWQIEVILFCPRPLSPLSYLKVLTLPGFIVLRNIHQVMKSQAANIFFLQDMSIFALHLNIYRSDIVDVSGAVSNLPQEAAHGNAVWGQFYVVTFSGIRPSISGKTMLETSLAVKKRRASNFSLWKKNNKRPRFVIQGSLTCWY